MANRSWMRAAGMAGGLALGAMAGAAPPSLNVEASFADTRAALAAGDADIVCIGDSLTFRPGGMHEGLRARMQLAYGNGGGGYQGLSVWTGAGNLLTVTSEGAAFVSAASATAEVREVTIATGPTRRVEFYPTGGGAVTLLGMVNVAGAGGVRVHRAANGGWGVENFLQRDARFEGQLQLIDPDMYIIMLGQNDQAFARETYAQRMVALIDRLRAATPAAEIVLVSTYDANSPLLINSANAMADAAAARGTGFINLQEYGGTYAEHVAAGRIDPDGVHFTPLGGAYVAGFIFDALHSGGASVDAACLDVDFNNNTVFPEDQDVIDLLTVLAGGPCSTPVPVGCDSIDFNRNGVYPEDADVVAFFGALAGQACE